MAGAAAGAGGCAPAPAAPAPGGAYDLSLILARLDIKPADWNAATGDIRATLLLSAAGCDASFRSFVAKRKVGLPILLRVADAFVRRNGAIRNPGGWWRHELMQRGELWEADQ